MSELITQTIEAGTHKASTTVITLPPLTPGQTQLTVQITVAADVQANLVVLDQLATTDLDLTVTMDVAQASSVNLLVLNAGHGNRHVKAQVHLNGEGAQSNLNVASVAQSQQQMQYDTQMHNQARHTIGHIQQRGLVAAHGQLDFKSVGQIIKGAVGSDAQQASRLLMLAESAQGNVDPILLIDENDVTAGHAASVGQVNQGQMYYLLSRGLDLHHAQKLVTRGFMQPALAFLPLAEQQTYLQAIEELIAHE
ncbi:MAG: SufD family Fe-S cluster assembly protein [Lactobacillaceae bacterium]|jgi:Fe-S cluster assembly protein SufD|nr:SufD family Fe-S cluster assembly protein [Lactobacillaceae bacterium]